VLLAGCYTAGETILKIRPRQVAGKGY